MMRKSRKLIPLTGDESIDAFARMGNETIRKQRQAAPMLMNRIEEEVIRNILPGKGVARIVANTQGGAQYIKVRMRKFLTSLGWNEYIATSLRGNELIIWQIAKYNRWRLKPPINESPIWIDSRSEDVTFYQDYDKGYRDQKADLAEMKRKLAESDSKLKSSWAGVNLDAMKIVLKANLVDGVIRPEDYEAKLAEIKIEEENRKESDDN